MIRKKIILFLFFSYSIFSCEKKNHSIEKSIVNFDSLALDIFSAEITSLYDTRVEVSIRDYLIIGDTIFVSNKLLMYGRDKSNGNLIDLKIDSSSFLVIKEFNHFYCWYNIYDSNKKPKGISFLPFKEAINLQDPYSDDLKIYFYDVNRLKLIKYKTIVAKKYGLTFDELDSLSFVVRPKINKLRMWLNDDKKGDNK